MRSVLNDELDGNWVNGGRKFADAFAHDKAIDLEIQNALGDIPEGNVDQAIDDFLNSPHSKYSPSARRWTNIPEDLTKENATFYNSHAENLNSIITYFKLDDCSRAFDSHNTHIHHENAMARDEVGLRLRTKPDFVILGRGRSISPEQSFPETIVPAYSQCKSVIEGKINGSILSAHTRIQLATYARECFIQGHNRWFVYGLLLTEKKVYIVKFDRAGAMYSSGISIHEDPAMFVRIVLGISLRDEKHVGYDTSIFWRDGTRFIQSRGALEEVVEYEVEDGKPFFIRHSIRGRATTCWRVIADEEPAVIKDSWRAKDRKPEREILKEAQGLDGVGQMIAYDTDIEEDVSDTRYGVPLISEDGHEISNRTITRTVLKCYGESIEHFSSRKELLCAFRDAVAGHRNMWKKGILHRDVSIQNVLLGDASTDANRGLLIDVDLAIFINRMKSTELDWRTGTRAFQSLMVLSHEGWKHDYLDDLESFFYVLCWVCLGYDGPGRPIPLSRVLASWEDDDVTLAKTSKGSFTAGFERQRIPSWFGTIFEDLLQNLRKFCQRRVTVKMETSQAVCDCYDVEAVQGGATPLGFSADDDYAEYLDIIDRAIEQLGDTPDGPLPEIPSRKQGTAKRPSSAPTNTASREGTKSSRASSLRTKRPSADEVQYGEAAKRPAKRVKGSQSQSQSGSSKPPLNYAESDGKAESGQVAQ